MTVSTLDASASVEFCRAALRAAPIPLTLPQPGDLMSGLLDFSANFE
ncbi:hypothetical protein BH24ACT5_BH24ACT5_04540 [soil metagenome]